MKLFAWGTLLAIVQSDLLASAYLVRRDPLTILADLKQCNSDITSVKSAVDAYNGSGSQVITINNAVNKLNTCINKATSDCNASAVATDAQAKDIISYISGTFEPNIKSTLASIKNKRATFTSNGLGGTVSSQLKAIQSNINGSIFCLYPKTPTTQKAAASSVGAKVQSDLSDAVNYYA